MQGAIRAESVGASNSSCGQLFGGVKYRVSGENWMDEASGQHSLAQSLTKVFISYAREDAAFVERLEAVLKQRGVAPLIDKTEIYAFDDWWKRIETVISQSDSVVFVISPDSVSSEVCRKEIAFADSLNKRLAPGLQGAAAAISSCNLKPFNRGRFPPALAML